MALMHETIYYGDKGKVIFVAPRVAVVLLFLTLFGGNEVCCDEGIPFCKDPLKTLENNEEAWNERCLFKSGVKHAKKLAWKMTDSPCCKAEKKNLQERKCKHSQMCFYQGNKSKLFLILSF